MEVLVSPDHIVLDGNPAPPEKGTAAATPPFSAHVCCGRTAEWIKMSLGMEVGLGLGPNHIVLSSQVKSSLIINFAAKVAE